MSIGKRSELSLTFERRWSEIRREGELVPPRAAFEPVNLIEFLPTLALVEIDPQARSMPVKLAGSAIRDLIGFELTGRDFLETHTDLDEAAVWQHRTTYHDHPCGRYEVLDIKFSGGFRVECCLTILPLWGTNQQRLIVLYAEPQEISTARPPKDSVAISSPAKFASCIDIGGGVPY